MTGLSYKKQKIVVIISFTIVPIILLIMFSYYPAVKLLELSFSNWDGINKSYDYVDFINYMDFFKDQQAMKALLNNAAYLVMGFIQVILGLYLAIVLNGNIKGKNFFRSVIFLPVILNGVAITYMFNYMYSYEHGPINIILNNIGLGNLAIRWLSDSYFSNFSIAFIALWRGLGFMMVVFLGALQSIPEDMFEAVELDGANFYHKIRYIIIPSIKTVIELNLFLAVNWSLQAFFEAFVLTKQSPGGVTDTFVTSTIKIAFQFFNFGKASAMGVFLMVIIFILTGLQRKLVRSEGDML